MSPDLVSFTVLSGSAFTGSSLVVVFMSSVLVTLSLSLSFSIFGPRSIPVSPFKITSLTSSRSSSFPFSIFPPLSFSASSSASEALLPLSDAFLLLTSSSSLSSSDDSLSESSLE